MSVVKRSISILNVARQTLPEQVLWFQPPRNSFFNPGKIDAMRGELVYTIDGVDRRGVISTEGDTITIEWL